MIDIDQSEVNKYVEKIYNLTISNQRDRNLNSKRYFCPLRHQRLVIICADTLLGGRTNWSGKQFCKLI